MIDSGTIIQVLLAIATSVKRDLTDRQKARRDAELNRSPVTTTARLQQLEESDLQQVRLLSELSRNVGELGKAIQAEAEKNKARDTRVMRFACGALVTGLVALAASIIVLLR
jgi:hypothetical protein